MADRDFEFDRVGNSYAHAVQRRSVLWVLTEPTRNDEEVRARTKELVLRWRARLSNLTAHGLALGGRLRTQTIRNCPPPFALPETRTMMCNMRLICPFCYARRAARMWERVDQAFPNRPNYSTTEFPYRLVEAYMTRNFPYPVCEDEDDSPLTEHLRVIFQGLVAGRVTRLKPAKLPGALVQATIEPTGQGWRVRARELYMIETGREYEEVLLGLGWQVRGVEQPTRLDIGRAVARVMRYPRGLMYGAAGPTVQLLQARKQGSRLMACYGQFRGGVDEREAEDGASEDDAVD